MSYKGLEFSSHDDYIFSDTIPYNPDFDLNELKIIQNKLQNYIQNKSNESISFEEAEVFLDWITYNARNYAVKDTPETPMTASMAGQCAPTQRINVTLLKKMGLQAKAFNTYDCIGDIPMRMEDVERIINGWSSSAVAHSISLVDIPITDQNGTTQEYKFLLDPTFRQFCKRENCTSDKFFDITDPQKVAPDPGFFMQASNLMQLGVQDDIAHKTEKLGRQIISKGYFNLNEENAKLYGDAFARASKRYEFQDTPINMRGIDYISNFENIPMKILGENKQDEKFLKMPSEIKEKKQLFFSRMISLIKDKIFKKQVLTLEKGKQESYGVKYKTKQIDEYRLNEQQMEEYNSNLMNEINQNKNDYNKKIEDDNIRQ